MRNSRTRITLFVLFVAACIIGSAGYAVRRSRVPAAVATAPLSNPADPAVASMLDEVRAAPHLIFQSRRLDALGRVAMTRLETLEPSLIIDTEECERSHFSKQFGLCLELNYKSREPRAFGVILDRHFQELTRFPLPGLPIRARISRDERYGAATVFVTGESYGGDFTTRTTIIDLATKKLIANLEEFAVERDGKPFRNVDFNFWGVTFFQDGNRFYATLGTGGKRLLVEGDIGRRMLKVVGSDVECPSLSPDEHHLVFKRQRSSGTGWRLWALDLATRHEWPITEDGLDVDDQVEWLDNSRVIYGLLYGQAEQEASLSLWISDITPASGLNQRLYLRSALSPSVIR
jgi:hypothetical protein